MRTLITAHIEKQKEVSEEKYTDMLEVLPPQRMATNGFLVGEPYDHDHDGRPRFALYMQELDRYYFAGYATTKDFDLMTHLNP